MAASYKTIHPVKYYRDFLAQNVRPDGRSLQTFRPVSINVGSIKTAEGSAIVKIGNTTVVCGIKAELAKPKAEEPNFGYLVPNVELPPLCSPKFRPGPPSDQAQVSSNFIAETLTNSRCIDLRDLCIVSEHLAWVLHCDLICLDHDGSLLDACVIALVAALRTVELPHVLYDAEAEKTVVSAEKRSKLKVHSEPVATTYTIFDDEILLTDPTNEEESLSSGIMTVVVQGDKLCSVHKPGGSPLTDAQLQECINGAMKRAEHINKLINTALKSHET
ncbi:exosome complex component RRP43-like isoform X2 [Zootermopsis nevadensis]|uniref:Ribosomal RNA-processing protein 43 n=1 Tax=Zootermopsis nevadensis TaxID=136037 RepID=A0A067RJ27_ZOONE|nr:exosome complex component RRP43-like isoform X2 [Zootermopsis nevadensis]KDR23812.1 Exosome complex exonuclease RRP43 [Zootermopsis nevadensis]